jgi:uncharacterized membrane protein (UPF0182 family)
MRTDRRSDEKTDTIKLVVVFRNFAKVPNISELQSILQFPIFYFNVFSGTLVTYHCDRTHLFLHISVFIQ